MYGIMKRRLEARATNKNPIRVGFVGAVRMGSGAICQIGLMADMRASVIADLDPERAARAFALAGRRRDEIVFTNRVGEAEDALRADRPVVSESAELVSAVGIDAVVDATGAPDVGARVAMQAIMAGKHVVMLNVETDVAIGPILNQRAERVGVVYTVASGDKPGLIAEFFDRYSLLGFEIGAVGKAASSLVNFDPSATPESLAEDAHRLGINPHFLVTFRDGTKTMIEMAAASNDTGLEPDVPGMHGPIAGVEEIVRLFRPKSEGGILNRRGVVDYARPLMTAEGTIDFHRRVTPGVFRVLHTAHQQIRVDLDYLDVTGADGYDNSYTPYHFVTNELPLSIAAAVLDNHPTVYARRALVTGVTGVAKRPLKAGEVIDGLGGAIALRLERPPRARKGKSPGAPMPPARRASSPGCAEGSGHHARHGRPRHRDHALPSPRAAGRWSRRHRRRGARCRGAHAAAGGSGLSVRSKSHETDRQNKPAAR